MTPKPSRSRPPIGVGYVGPLPDQIWEVVATAYATPLAVSGNYAREHAVFVALAASLGWITNVAPDGRAYSRTWSVTHEGILALQHKDTFA